jgi:hypothetical protein
VRTGVEHGRVSRVDRKGRRVEVSLEKRPGRAVVQRLVDADGGRGVDRLGVGRVDRQSENVVALHSLVNPLPRGAGIGAAEEAVVRSGVDRSGRRRRKSHVPDRAAIHPVDGTNPGRASVEAAKDSLAVRADGDRIRIGRIQRDRRERDVSQRDRQLRPDRASVGGAEEATRLGADPDRSLAARVDRDGSDVACAQALVRRRPVLAAVSALVNAPPVRHRKERGRRLRVDGESQHGVAVQSPAARLPADAAVGRFVQATRRRGVERGGRRRIQNERGHESAFPLEDEPRARIRFLRRGEGRRNRQHTEGLGRLPPDAVRPSVHPGPPVNGRMYHSGDGVKPRHLGGRSDRRGLVTFRHARSLVGIDSISPRPSKSHRHDPVSIPSRPRRGRRAPSSRFSPLAPRCPQFGSPRARAARFGLTPRIFRWYRAAALCLGGAI